MPRKSSPEQIEQKQFRAINPEDVKKAIEIPVKQKPSKEKLEIIEKEGNCFS